ncbi:MAG: hypothetical protein PVJ41_08930 [Desulfobacterales bacterium]
MVQLKMGFQWLGGINRAIRFIGACEAMNNHSRDPHKLVPKGS